MAKKTFRCPNCGQELEANYPMTVELFAVCDVCYSAMRREYRALGAIAFSPFEVLTDWSIENLRRVKAKERRFSRDKVNRPVSIPGKEYRTRR